jgi:hypothetical protein
VKGLKAHKAKEGMEVKQGELVKWLEVLKKQSI